MIFFNFFYKIFFNIPFLSFFIFFFIFLSLFLFFQKLDIKKILIAALLFLLTITFLIADIKRVFFANGVSLIGH